jgi:hypothetical protein
MLLVEDIILASKIEGRHCEYVRTGNSGVWHQLGFDGGFSSQEKICVLKTSMSLWEDFRFWITEGCSTKA